MSGLTTIDCLDLVTLIDQLAALERTIQNNNPNYFYTDSWLYDMRQKLLEESRTR